MAEKARSLKQGIIQYEESIRYVAISSWLLVAGGSFATTAYKTFKHPVASEEIKADAGIDIGDTLIGMHLKKVAVPVRLESNKIGEAHIVAAPNSSVVHAQYMTKRFPVAK